MNKFFSFVEMAGDSTGQVTLVTGGYDHTIRLWQAHSGVCLRIMQHPDSVCYNLLFILLIYKLQNYTLILMSIKKYLT